MKATLSLFLMCLVAVPIQANDRPNIMLILVDDLGRDWMSCYGAKHQTPNIDQLAKQGVRYETAWSMPIGIPSRVTLLTGQYPFRHGWTRNDDVPPPGGEGLSWTTFTTFVRVLRRAGYETAIGGKWQLNHVSKQPATLNKHGFDEHCVWTGAGLNRPKTKLGYWDVSILTNGKRTTVSYGPDTVISFMTAFIRKKRRKPFFVYYPMLLTQKPLEATPRNKDNPPKSQEALYAGNVSYVDHLVGKLIDAVDESGRKQNTMIVFTSDNGSSVAGVLQGKPFQRGKGLESDRGARVPFVVRAPFLTQGGRVSRDLIDFTDLYPTFVELSKATPPKGIPLDGRSIVPSLRGSEDPFEKRNWIFSQVGDFRMIRDWQHIVDNKGNFHDLTKDPLQQTKVSPLDKIAPGRRQRLEMILKRLPNNAPAPHAKDELRPNKTTPP